MKDFKEMYKAYITRRRREEADYEKILEELVSMGCPEAKGAQLLAKEGMRPGQRGEGLPMPGWAYAALAMMFAVPVSSLASFGMGPLAIGFHFYGLLCTILAYAWYIAVASKINRVWGMICLLAAIPGQLAFVLLHIDNENVFRPLPMYFGGMILLVMAYVIDNKAIADFWQMLRDSM